MFAWGKGEDGTLGIGERSTALKPRLIEGLLRQVWSALSPALNPALNPAPGANVHSSLHGIQTRAIAIASLLTSRLVQPCSDRACLRACHPSSTANRADDLPRRARACPH